MSTARLPKIKILFLGANPSNTTRIALGDEVREIMQRLRAAHQGEQFEFVQEWAVRVGDLQAALLRHRPQIVHFSGHGRGEGDAFSRSGPSSDRNREMLPEEDVRVDDGDGEILVEDDSTRQARPLPAAALAKLFKLVGGIRCVVLNACHSATQAEAICEHVEAVIGMRRSIHDEAAVNFAWAFYQGLGFGESLSSAFEFGKNQIELAGFGDGDVPQLLTKEMRAHAPSAPKQPTWRPIGFDGDEESIDPFLLRVERVAKLRHPGARITRKVAPPPFSGVLEVEVDAGGFVRTSIVTALNQALLDELANRFVADVDRPFRRHHPQLRSTLVHQGAAAPLALRARLDRLGIELQTFDSYQGLFDLQPYLEWQTRELDKNPAYLARTYVDAPAWIKIAGSRELQHSENALQTILELLAAQQHRRFLLVLGEFGAGKTFLLRELCRQMVQTSHPVVPVLLEMSKLEKQHSLAELLGAHFARADVPGYNFKAFEYMLGEGRVALFFDGFDELADKVTYDSATQHLDTVLSATHGQAKVVLSSRRQHFLTEGDIHKAVEREFARKAESAVQGGYRLIMLEPFAEPQIRLYLRNVLADESAAEARYRLLDEVKDLIGLSHNPRMLSFIAGIPEESLREAKERWGEITAAKLYELLVNHWLDFEHTRSKRQGSSTRISRRALLRGVESLALSLWQTRSRVMRVDEIHAGIAHALAALGEPPLDAAVLTHIFGSGSLLVRDEEGLFSFVHRSVMEWLVAKQAADDLMRGQDPSALVVDEMSALMADFFAAMAGRERVATWAREKLAVVEEAILRTNATLLLARMGERFERVSFEGQDLRGRDLSRVEWRGANLRGVDLRGAMLKGADLRGASLVGANLSHADLRGANLTSADLEGADFSFVRADGADFSSVQHWEANRFRGANLLRAKGILEERYDHLRALGAVPPELCQIEPMHAVVSEYKCIACSHDGLLVAMVHEEGTITIFDAIRQNIIRILAGHFGDVHWVVFSPDGMLLASSAEDRTIRLWDVVTGRLLRICEGHQGSVHCVAFSADCSKLASGSGDRTIRIWDTATGQPLTIFKGHASAVRAVAFSPDDKLVASGSADRTVKLWEHETGGFLRTFRGHGDIVYNVAFSPDGMVLASGSSDNTVRSWDLSTGEARRKLNSKEIAYRLGFSPNGKVIAIGSSSDTSSLWQVAKSRSLLELAEQATEIYNLAFGANSDGVANASAGMYRSSAILTNYTFREMEKHTAYGVAFAFAPDGKLLAASSGDKKVRVWDVATGRVVQMFADHLDVVLSVAFSPEGKTIASGSDDNTVRLWSAATGRLETTLRGHTFSVNCVAFSPDGRMLASGSFDETIRLYDATTHAIKHIFRGHKDSVTSVAFSQDSTMLLSGSSDATARLWDVRTGRLLQTLGADKSVVQSVAFSPDGKLLAFSSWNKSISLYEVAECKVFRVLSEHDCVAYGIAFSPSGTMLVSTLFGNTLRLWDVTTGQTLRVFEGHASAVLSVAFSPDGKTIASGSYDNTVRLWDVASGQCLAILLATPEGWVAFTPDGRYKYGGNIAGSFWHVAGLCRFEPGELDDYLPLRLPDDAPFLPAKP